MTRCIHFLSLFDDGHTFGDFMSEGSLPSALLPGALQEAAIYQPALPAVLAALAISRHRRLSFASRRRRRRAQAYYHFAKMYRHYNATP